MCRTKSGSLQKGRLLKVNFFSLSLFTSTNNMKCLPRSLYLEQDNGDRKKWSWKCHEGAQKNTTQLAQTCGTNRFHFLEAEERRKDKGRGTKSAKHNKFESEANEAIKQKKHFFRSKNVEKGFKRRKAERTVGLWVTLPSWSLCVGVSVADDDAPSVDTREHFLACSISAIMWTRCSVFAVWWKDVWKAKVKAATSFWMTPHCKLWFGCMAGRMLAPHSPEARAVPQRSLSSTGRTGLCDGWKRILCLQELFLSRFSHVPLSFIFIFVRFVENQDKAFEE